jgi:cell division protein ZapE
MPPAQASRREPAEALASGGAEAAERAVVQAYRAALAARGFAEDAAQLQAILALQDLADRCAEHESRRRAFLGRWFRRSPPPRGLWLWGGVGRGKSFLMDCFHQAVAVDGKTRIHFHEFMRGVHRELEQLKGRTDPLDEVARRVAARHRLILFDEFHVSDIADAMILERLMRALFAQGVCFVMTSNYRPDDLYPEGLHRDRVLPAIALIKAHCEVLQVDAGTDYRRAAFDRIEAYHQPLDQAAEQALEEAWQRLAEGSDEDPVIEVENRPLRALRRAGGVIWFDFETLCDGPRSQNDYLELATRYHTVLLSAVPKMSAGMASAARRFVWLIDVLYDQRIKLVMSAECPPDELYESGAMAGEFHRTVSRIAEMQSREYLQAPRRGLAGSLS